MPVRRRSSSRPAGSARCRPASRRTCGEQGLGLRQRALDVVQRPAAQPAQRVGGVVAHAALEQLPALGEVGDGVDPPRAQERRVVEVVEARRALDLRGHGEAVAAPQRLERGGQRHPQPAVRGRAVDRLDAQVDAREGAREPQVGAHDADHLVCAREARDQRRRPRGGLAGARVPRGRGRDQRDEQQRDRRLEAASPGEADRHGCREQRYQQRRPPRPAEQRPGGSARDEARGEQRQRRERARHGAQRGRHQRYHQGGGTSEAPISGPRSGRGSPRRRAPGSRCARRGRRSSRRARPGRAR